jgi:predicted membrane GTPase involved in stress response
LTVLRQKAIVVFLTFKVAIEQAGAGEIVSIAGLPQGTVNHTLCENEENGKPIPVSIR